MTLRVSLTLLTWDTSVLFIAQLLIREKVTDISDPALLEKNGKHLNYIERFRLGSVRSATEITELNSAEITVK